MCARPSDPNAKIDLLCAAEAVFVERGLDRARVQEITARAGRSKGSFYLHFDSKEDAFRQIVESLVARLAGFIDHFGRIAETECAPGPAAHLERWLDCDVQLFEYIWQNRGLSRLVFEGGNSAAFGYLIDEFAERARSHIQKMLALGVRRGLYRRQLDLELASLVIAGAYDRVGRQLVRLKEKPDLRRWLRQLQEVVVGGIAGDSLRSSRDVRVAHQGLLDPSVKNSAGSAAPGVQTPRAPRRPRGASTSGSRARARARGRSRRFDAGPSNSASNRASDRTNGR